jgi:hypothetical protein
LILYIYFRIELFVDDKSIGRGRLGNRFDKITVREDGGLYLGGLPTNFDTNVGDKAAVSQTLDGCISDVVINGKYVIVFMYTFVVFNIHY